MTELEALRRVADAARAVARVPNLDGRIIEALRHHLDALDALPAPATPARSRLAALEALRAMVRDYDRGTGQNVRWADIMATLDELDALPAPAAEPEGEVVEVVVSAWRHRDGSVEVFAENARMQPQFWQRIATIRARVPLPRVPEVVGEVG